MKSTYQSNDNKKKRVINLFHASPMYIVAFILATSTISSCNNLNTEDKIQNNIDSFTASYFNWEYQKTIKYCTDDSKKWIIFAASNVHQADIDLLNNKKDEVSHEITDITFTDDSNAVASVTVNNFLRMDTIGKAAQHIDKAKFKLNVKSCNGKWLIELKGLPRESKKDDNNQNGSPTAK